MARLLEELAPDRLEVSDRTTLRWTGKWARRARVPAVMVSHETRRRRAAHLGRAGGERPGAPPTRSTVRTAHTYARVVCTTELAEREFVRIGARNVVRAPLGVDLGAAAPGAARRRAAGPARARGPRSCCVHVLPAVAWRSGPARRWTPWRRCGGAGVRAVLVVAGRRAAARRGWSSGRADAGCRSTFLGHVADRGLLGRAPGVAPTCAWRPGPAETFGLAALEAHGLRHARRRERAPPRCPRCRRRRGRGGRPRGGLRGRRGAAPGPPRGRTPRDGRTRACGVLRLGHGGRRLPRGARRGCPSSGRPPASPWQPACQARGDGTGGSERCLAERGPGRLVGGCGPCALGDSLTEGVGDPVGRRVARLGRAARRTGSATPGARGVHQPRGQRGADRGTCWSGRLPAALELRPDVVSVVVGVNDTLRCTFDIHAVAARLDTVYAAFAEQGAVLLTACLPDPGTMLGLPGALARPLARRQRAVNAVVHALSERYGAVHLHAAEGAWPPTGPCGARTGCTPASGDTGNWPCASTRCWRSAGLATGAAPSAEPEFPVPTTSASLWWLATAGTGWVARRCTDLLPQLLTLAADELRHRARGTSARLDLRASTAVSAALGRAVGGGRAERG